MKPCPRVLVALLLTASAVYTQEPIPICGLPYIHALSPDEPVVLHKRMTPSENPTFLIREHFEKNSLIEVEFELLFSDSDFKIYAEATEVDAGRVDSSSIEALVTIFRDRTFSGSIDSSKGIKAIAEDVFGRPPDIDHNGQVYILLIDIRDDYVPDSSETYIAGYFDPLDQRQQGNLADIIYLDTNPGTVTGPDAHKIWNTLAHEYQHLIHYGRDSREEQWVNEGLSELAPVLVGLQHRDFARYLADTNQRLDSFSGDLADYAKVGLFFLYTWVQSGTQFIRDLVASTRVGIDGMDDMLVRHNQPEIDAFVFNWHAANYIQGEGNLGYDGRFSLPLPNMHDIITSFPEDNFERDVKSLGARWTLITGGEDLFIFAARHGVEPELTLIKGDDLSFIEAPTLCSSGYQDAGFGTTYHDLVVLATSSTGVDDSAFFSLFVNAEGGFENVVLSYDGDEGSGDVMFIQLGDGAYSGEAAVAYSINVPEVELSAIQFMCANDDAVVLKIFRQVLEESQVVYRSEEITPLGATWTMQRIPAGLKAGNERVFVSVESTDNALAYNEHITQTYSWYRPPGESTFDPLDWFLVDGEILEGNWSVRLTYQVPDTDRDTLIIPVIVGQFHPNPVAGVPLTRINVGPGYAVELVLYNLLGQEVSRLTRPVDSVEPLFWNGTMSNGRPVPSGVYLAQIRAGGEIITRKVTLIR